MSLQSNHFIHLIRLAQLFSASYFKGPTHLVLTVQRTSRFGPVCPVTKNLPSKTGSLQWNSMELHSWIHIVSTLALLSLWETFDSGSRRSLLRMKRVLNETQIWVSVSFSGKSIMKFIDFQWGLIENIEHVTTLVLFQFFGNVHNPHDTVSFILIHIHRSALRLESCKICIGERSLPALFVVIIM